MGVDHLAERGINRASGVQVQLKVTKSSSTSSFGEQRSRKMKTLAIFTYGY
jgi:hypothetical protein